MSETTAPFFRLESVSVIYGRQRAVDGLDLHVDRGEVVGLLGDNGAGKSTTIRLMSGTTRLSAGRILVDGSPTTVRSRKDSEAIGIETIYQDSALVNQMSIMRNLFLSRELSGPLGLMRAAEMRRMAMDILRHAVSISGIDDPDKEVGSLSGGQKQAVAIARAVHFKRRMLLLDEPTSALSVRETEKLLQYIRSLKGDGVASVLVTHNLYHAFEVCDRFVVMSHGRKVLDIPRHATTLRDLTSYVVRL